MLHRPYALQQEMLHVVIDYDDGYVERSGWRRRLSR